MVWQIAYEGEGGEGDAGDGNTPEGSPPLANEGNEGGDKKPDTKKSFSQEDVNKLVEAARTKQQDETRKALGEIELLRKKATLSEQQKKELDKRVKELNNSLLTAEELARKESEEQKSKYENQISDLTKDRDGWRTRYETETIVRSIVDEASKRRAYNPDQIVRMLQGYTELAEDLDDSGQPTGSFTPKVKFPSKDKDGKPITLSLSVDEAVKKMTTMDEYLNLFKSEGTGGIGGTHRAGGGSDVNAVKIIRSQGVGAYIEQRKSEMNKK